MIDRDGGRARSQREVPSESNDSSPTPSDPPVKPQGWGNVWPKPSSVIKVGDEPDYRFTLANERTFLAWIRTALALLAGGVAVIKLVPNFSLAGGRHLLGVPLIVLSLALSFAAYRHWAFSERAMRLNRPLPVSFLAPLLAGVLSLITIAALVLLLLGEG